MPVEVYSTTLPTMGDTIRTLLGKIDQQLTSGGGSGGAGQQFFAANYGGLTPTDTPANGAGEAVDTSTGRVWLYYSGAWH